MPMSALCLVARYERIVAKCRAPSSLWKQPLTLRWILAMRSDLSASLFVMGTDRSTAKSVASVRRFCSARAML